MAGGEFLLLDQLGVSVPDASVQETKKTSSREGYYRVVSPCRCPPFKGKVYETEKPSVRSAPVVPLADYSGEVVVVKGQNNGADVEYIIYNARVPSIRAANMQLIEEKQRRRAEEKARRMSPDVGFFRHSEPSYEARRRILENLQRINKEHVQRKIEERSRERQRRLEREAAELHAAAEQLAKENAAAVAKKRAERESLYRASLNAIERKKQEAAGASRTTAFDCAPFLWSEYASKNASNMRARSVALMEANRELAERAIRERQERKMEERVRERAAMLETKSQIESENRRASEKRRRLQEQQRSVSVETYRKRAGANAVHDGYSTVEWFPYAKSDGESRQRERHQKLMAENKQLAEELRRRRAEDADRQLQYERRILQESQLAYEKEKQHALETKRRGQDILFKAALGADLERSARKKVSLHRDSSCDFFTDKHSKSALEVRERQRTYREELKRDILAVRNARLEAKERETALEKRLLEMNEAEARRSELRAHEKALQRREEYSKALEQQLRSKKLKGECKVPAPQRGTERRVLYRCPVTGDLLSPDKFGVPSGCLRSTRWFA